MPNLDENGTSGFILGTNGFVFVANGQAQQGAGAEEKDSVTDAKEVGVRNAAEVNVPSPNDYVLHR